MVYSARGRAFAGLLACLLLSGTCLSAAEIPPASALLSIAKWKDDKRAALSMGSDDGLVRCIKSTWTLGNPNVPYDGYYLLKAQYQIPVTFFIDPKQLDDPVWQPFSSYAPVSQPPSCGGTWQDWLIMHNQGHEIASHTYSHAAFNSQPGVYDPEYEMSEAAVRIQANIGVRPLSFNMPFTAAPSSAFAMARQYYPVIANDCWADAEHVYFDFSDATIQGAMEARLNTAIAARKWFSGVGHGIRTELGRAEEAVPGFAQNGMKWDGFGPIEYSVLDAFFRYAATQRDSLFIGTFREVRLYQVERREAVFKIISDAPGTIVFEVNHALDAQLYNVPITVRVPGWMIIQSIAQGTTTLTPTVKGWFKVFDVLPNQGAVTLRWDETGIRLPNRGKAEALALTFSPLQNSVRFVLPFPGDVALSFFDAHGRKFATDFAGPKSSGEHVVSLPSSLRSSGCRVFYCRLEMEFGIAGKAFVSLR